MKKSLLLSLLFIVAICLSGGAQAADLEGSKDHPLISRFSGATIVAYKASDFDEATMPVKPLPDDDNVPADQLLTLEGKVTQINYEINNQKTALEVMRNYEQALDAAQFKTVFKCNDDACGDDEGLSLGAYLINSGKVRPPGFGGSSFNAKNRYLLARRQQGSEDVYALIYVMNDDSNKEVWVYEQVVEIKAMQTGQVQVLTADQMQQSLTSEGKVAIYGVYFDTAKADVKTESKPSLDQMTKLLKTNAALKVYIVGHTDNVGALSGNMDLSQRRADAVVKALSAQGIDAGRMAAKGIASLSPVASNADEAGRAKNRRVELVVQ